jgi:antitoxin component of MazEF toxin-antitoxin module
MLLHVGGNMIKMQKVIKVGNSLAVTLDRDFVAKTGIVAGDLMAASYKPEKKVLSMAQSKTALKGKLTTEKESIVSSKVTPELEEWMDSFLERNKEAMEALKDL